MTVADETRVDFDPLDGRFIEDPHAVLGELRSSCPISHSDRWGGFWALTRRADVLAAAKDHKHFINSVLHIIPGGLAHHTRPLMHSDPPEHTRFRDAMLPVFNGPAGEAILPDVRAYAEARVHMLTQRDAVDLVKDYCGPLMAYTLTRFYAIEGVSAEDLDSWLRQYVDGGQRRDQDSVLDAHAKLWKVASDLVADRRRRPRDPSRDLVTALVQASYDGEPLDEEKVIGAIRQPFVIVWLATSHSLGNMVERLLRDPELAVTLRRQPSLIGEALEEFLRMDMPQLGFGRTAATDLEFRGVHLHEGDPVALVFPAANRDPEVFDQPDEFRIGRTPNPHLTFGAGIHSCPGKNIARAIIRAALESLINGTHDMQLDGMIEREHWPFRAPRTLPARLTARAD